MTGTARPADLPDFKRPPVTEVVLSIQFAPIAAFRSIHVGLLWNELRRDYPSVTEQPALPPNFETFGVLPGAQPGAIQVEMLLSPPMPRFWLEDTTGEHLLQIQQDRIVHNWRKRDNGQRYPRYEAIRERFEAEVAQLGRFLGTEHLGDIQPNQCEVTYINTIDLPEDVNPHHHLDRITPLWTGRLTEDYPLELENTVVQSRYLLRDTERSFGRVYVSFRPVVRMIDYKPAVQLEITARGKPNLASVNDAWRLLDQERRVVVQTFAAVTTSEMHEIWERSDGR